MKNHLRALTASALLILAACAGTQEAAMADTEPDCSAKCLLEMAGGFMDNMVDQYPDGVPFSETVRLTENGADIAIGEGIWKTSTAWSYRHTVVDPVQGGIGIFGVIREDTGEDAMVAFRLKVEDCTFTEVEALVVREGEFPLFVTDMTRARPLYYQYVPEEKRNTRDELAAIAEGYFHGLANGDPSALSFHPDCNRQENGFQTTNNPPRMTRSCADLYPFVYMHSYRTPDFPVIDTERGLVLGVTAFDMPDQETTIMIRGKPFRIDPAARRLPRTLFLYELFKVEDGMIMVIDAFLMNQPYGASMGWNDR
ncbi:MAG: hypothetical protein CMK07_11115 [Ponticaulis sp.]|nr:hypothetical protein [Ponticaulis sp.]